MGDETLDTSELEDAAKALVRREWSTAASLLVQIATTAMTGNPFVGIAAGAGAEWLWATAAAQSATAKLKAAEAELEKLDEADRVAFVQRCLRQGFSDASANDPPIGVVPSDVGTLGALLEEGLAQVLRSLALLHSKVDALAQSLPLSPSRIDEHLLTSTTRWSEEVDDSIAGILTLPRAELRTKVNSALQSSRVVVVLGESGVGKSALARAVVSGRPYVCAVHALELRALLDRLDLDSLRDGFVPEGAVGIFLVDGVEHLNSPDALRALALLIRLLLPSAAETRWHVAFTCRPGAWESIVRDLGSPDALLSAAEVAVPALTKEELQLIADSFPGVLRAVIDNKAVGRLKLLDLVARQPTNTQSALRSNATEAQLADWYWRTAIVRGPHGGRRGEIIKSLARRRQESGSLRAPLSLLEPSELDLLAPLQDEGVLRVKDDTVRLAHDWLETIGLERLVLETYGSGNIAGLVSASAQPGWHASLQLGALHCLESDGSARWLDILAAIRKDPGGDMAADLWSDAALDSSDVASVLSAARALLVQDEGRLLGRVLRRFIHRRSLMHPAVAESLSGASAALRALAAKEVRYRLPIPGPCWVALLGWLGDQPHSDLNAVHGPLLDLIDIALNHRLFGFSFVVPATLIDYTLATTERYIVARERRNGMPVPDEQDYRLLLTMRDVPTARLAALLREAAGRGKPPPPPAPPSDRLPEVLRRTIIPRGAQEEPWPHGPNREPDRFLRSFALTQPGASLLVQFDIDVACEIFLALLIQPPGDADRYDLNERRINDFHGISFPPFHDFVPAQALFGVNPTVATRFVVTLADFAAERWLVGRRATERRWQGAEEPSPDDAVPAVTLLIDGRRQHYLGDSQVFGWSRGVEVGPYAVKAALMALERWLLEACETDTPPLDEMRALIRDAKSVAVLGVLTDIALRFPGLLVGPLEPLVSCLHLYWWNYRLAIMADANASTALIGSRPVTAELRREMVDWHGAPHRKRLLHPLVTQLYGRRAFSWPALETARTVWLEMIDGQEVDLFLLRVIAEMDKDNWRLTENDGQRVYEYTEPQHLAEVGQARSEAAGRSLELQLFAFKMKSVLTGDAALSGDELRSHLATAKQVLLGEIEVPEIVEPIALAASAACVAIVQFREWLEGEPTWRAWCRDVVLDERARPKIADHPWSMGIAEISASRFAALALVELWMREEDANDVRAGIAAAVALGDGETVRLVLQSVSEREGALRCSEDVVTLVVLAARARGCLGWCRGRAPAEEAHWEDALASLQRAFCSKQLGPLPENWASLGTPDDTSMVKGPASPSNSETRPEDLAQAAATSLMRRAWDWQYIVEALASPALGFLWDAKAVGSTSDTILRELGKAMRAAWGVGRRGDQDWDYPSEVPRALIQLAALVALRDSSRQPQLLESWLRLPVGAAHWVAAFVGEAYTMAIRTSDSDNLFGALLRAITANLFGAGGWLFATRSIWRARRSEVLVALMGGASFVPVALMWPVERRELANSLENEIGMWLPEAFGRNGAPEHAISFMLTPALVDLRLRLLLAIEPLLLVVISGDRARSELTEGTVALLSMLWAEHGADIERERRARDAFDRLLVATTASQHASAIALSETVGRARRQGEGT